MSLSLSQAGKQINGPGRRTTRSRRAAAQFNQPDRANRRQALGFREQVDTARATGLPAAVAHPGR
jgi:hypothetical protein